MSALLRAFVIGYTGETGKSLVKALAKDPRYGSVNLIGRREVDLDYGTDAPTTAKAKFTQHVIDFEHLDDNQLLFDADVGFSAVGTTAGTSGKEQQRIIEHDYVIKVAELAVASGCKEFHMVSSQGADPKSRFFYLRLKGEIEEDLAKACVFPNYLAIYRPGALLCNRTERRIGERILTTLMKPINMLYPTWVSVPTTTLAQAMTNAPFDLASIMHKRATQATGDKTYDPKVSIVENAMLFDLAAAAIPNTTAESH